MCIILSCALLCFQCILPSNALAVTIISDLEIEMFLMDVVRPIFKVAKLDDQNIKIHIVKDESVNAFVYNNEVFVFTGLITFAGDTSPVFGVMSHEVGHIARKHISRMVIKAEENRKTSSTIIALSAIAMLGMLPAAGAIGSATVLAPMVGLSSIMANNLKYSRNHESEADESAIQYLNELGKPISGLSETMMYFNRQMSENSRVFKYFFTHPLPEERLETLNLAAKNNSHHVQPIDCAIEKRLRRVQAKILGFFNANGGGYDTPIAINAQHSCFTNQDLMFFELYEKVHVLWFGNKYKEALDLLGRFETYGIRKDDIFVLDTKANILFAEGKVEESIEIYRKITTLTDYQLAKVSLVRALLASNKRDFVEESYKLTKDMLLQDPENVAYHYHIALCASSLNDMMAYHAHMSVAQFQLGNFELAKTHAKKTVALIRKNSDREDVLYLENLALDVMDACPKKIKK